ncbi:MAG TPA: hypothetical protein VFB90_00235 [Dehalococcoidia bacterium]|nr:hypothetical protein [Dehalococcoidia bacterium]
MYKLIGIVGEDLSELMRLAAGLDRVALSTYVRQNEKPFQSLLESPMAESEICIVPVVNWCNAADLRALFACHPTTRFLFLAAEFPPAPAIARIVDELKGVILRRNESSVVVAATLLAMLASEKGAA